MKTQQPALTKNDLLHWINQRACCEYKNLEELGDCVAYICLLDVVHPKSFASKKIKCMVV